jgi:thioredoxin-like negative regulator of GroEL
MNDSYHTQFSDINWLIELTLNGVSDSAICTMAGCSIVELEASRESEQYVEAMQSAMTEKKSNELEKDAHWDEIELQAARNLNSAIRQSPSDVDLATKLAVLAMKKKETANKIARVNGGDVVQSNVTTNNNTIILQLTPATAKILQSDAGAASVIGGKHMEMLDAKGLRNILELNNEPVTEKNFRVDNMEVL